jgi:hypothetical protein
MNLQHVNHPGGIALFLRQTASFPRLPDRIWANRITGTLKVAGSLLHAMTAVRRLWVSLKLDLS